MSNLYAPLKSIISLVSTCIVLASVPSIADTDQQTESVHISVNSFDTSSNEGIVNLHAKIVEAASSVCRDAGKNSVYDFSIRRRCFHRTIKFGIKLPKNEKLIAFHGKYLASR